LAPNRFLDEETNSAHFLTLLPSQQLVLYLADLHQALLVESRSSNRALARRIVSDITHNLIPNNFKARVLLDLLDQRLSKQQLRRFTENRNLLNKKGFKVFSDFCPEKAFLQD